jgi:hypothetical protein
MAQMQHGKINNAYTIFFHKKLLSEKTQKAERVILSSLDHVLFTSPLSICGNLKSVVAIDSELLKTLYLRYTLSLFILYFEVYLYYVT